MLPILQTLTLCPIDFGEGLLEVALVVTSLYFISHKKMFPAIGIVAAIAGGALALIGVFA